jgi:glycosyltransferase involved in cell wall biosynthesis
LLGVPIFYLHWGPKKFLQLVWGTYSLARRWKPDGVVCYALGLHVSIALGARLAGVPRIVSHIGNTPPSQAWARRKIGWALQASRPLVRREITCSKTVEDQVRALYGLPKARLLTIYNSIDVENVMRRAFAARQQLSPNARPHIIGMVARLEIHKDHETLLKAFAQVIQERPSVRLRLIGDGSLRQKLETLAVELNIERHVEFLGMRQDIPEHLGQLDLFAFSTTKDEGFGIALIEALAAGIPVVASDVPACREVLKDGAFGILVPPGNPSALAGSILSSLDDPTGCTGRTHAAQEFIKEHFDAKTMTRNYEKALFG